MSASAPRRPVLARLAEIARAVGHEHRLELLEHLAQAERSVEVLAGQAGVTLANASQHLQALRRAGLVVTRREGRLVVYRLAGDQAVHLVECLRRVADQQVSDVGAALDDYTRRPEALEPVTPQELAVRLRQQRILVLDVRPADEFAAGHIPGAINIPLPTLARRARTLPRRDEIVAYCRGPYCVLSTEGVALLRTRGYRVRRMESGFPQWRAAGLPVQRGTRAPGASQGPRRIPGARKARSAL